MTQGGFAPFILNREDGMAEKITATMVKTLRENTGAGMMECKKALTEAQGNMADAEDLIAKSGHKKAAKSASRTAAEGRIMMATSTQKAVMMEINSETDFVARDANFITFSQTVSEIALDSGVEDVEALLALPFEGMGSVEEARKGLIAKIGENIQLRRLAIISAKANQRIGHYIHMNRIGTLILLTGGTHEVAKDIAMHIAAMKPQFISMQDIPQDALDRQKAIFVDIAKSSGKPEQIIEKIVAGQIQKHFSEMCLEGQAFFKDPDQTVGAYLKSQSATIEQMIRFEVGEGIEVAKKSFEEEVMEQARGINS